MNKRILTLVLVGIGGALLPVACHKGGETASSGGGPPAPSVTPTTSGSPTEEPDSGTDPTGWLGGKPCLLASDCTGADAGACATWDGKCDTTYRDTNGKGRCVVKLAANTECAPGHVHGGVAPNGTGLVHYCDAGSCKWDTNSGTPCGADGGPCCVGGCNGNLHCSSLVGVVGATCNP